MIQNGRALTKHKVTNIQTESVEKAALIRYFESLLEFTLDRSETNELAKDIWHLERLPLILRTNPIVNHKTLNFRGIRQPDIREEVKKAIYHHLKTEALFLLLIGSQLITFQLLEFQFIIHASLLSAYRQAGCFPLPQSMRHFL